MADIFREVDEELRNEKAVAALARWQPYIIVGALLFLAALWGYRYYVDHQKIAREVAGAQYQAAIDLARTAGGDATKTKAAEAALTEIAKTGPRGYQALALLREAAMIGKTDALKGAAEYDALAVNAKLDPLLQNVARLRAALLLVDTAKPVDMVRRLGGLATNQSPFAPTAREILAVSALSHNDLKAAGDWLDQIIIDPQASPEERDRAEQLSGIVRAGPLPGAEAASAQK